MSEKEEKNVSQGENSTPKQNEKRILNAKETALFAFSILEQKAWVSLGLVKDVDDEFHKSKEDARFLIDLLSKMAEQFESNIDEKAFNEIKGQISTLKLNFVNQFK